MIFDYFYLLPILFALATFKKEYEHRTIFCIFENYKYISFKIQF